MSKLAQFLKLQTLVKVFQNLKWFKDFQSFSKIQIFSKFSKFLKGQNSFKFFIVSKIKIFSSSTKEFFFFENFIQSINHSNIHSFLMCIRSNVFDVGWYNVFFVWVSSEGPMNQQWS